MADNDFKWRLENLRGAFRFGSRAVQAILLVNGGAAIALLALIGNLGAHPGFRVSILGLRWSLGSFAVGALLATFAMAFAWGAQLRTLDASATKDPGMGLRYAALAFGVVGMLAFALGATLAALAIG